MEKPVYRMGTKTSFVLLYPASADFQALGLAGGKQFQHGSDGMPLSMMSSTSRT
jgi:hypothetical protein